MKYVINILSHLRGKEIKNNKFNLYVQIINTQQEGDGKHGIRENRI